MSSEFDKDEISISVIEGMVPKELFQLSKVYDVKEFQDISELRQKLILTVMKKKKTVIETSFYTEDFKEKKEITFKEDTLRRNYLSKYLINIRAIYDKIKRLDKVKSPTGIDISEKDDPLITKIINEFKNLDEEFEKKSELVLKNPSCSLLICGDSGAGKSSFINLLIGEALLPTSIRSNTACQVRLTYSQNERAEIIDKNDQKIIIEKCNFSERLKGYLESYENRTEVTCNLATIFINCPILEGGLDIYDTIGLGESQLFNEEITKDLKDITGILFLLKRNNPIGDNTVGGLSKVINHMANYGIPGGSMHFIINMCDLLEGIEEKEDLKRNVIGQIKDRCTGLNPEITTFSTKRELFLQENKYMSLDYKNMMSLIQQLHINSINTNTVSIFEFLFRFVRKTIDYIVESEEFAAADRVNKKEYIHKLRNLESDRKLLNQSFKKENEKFLKDKYNKYKREIEKHFHLDDTKSKVVTDVVNKQNQLFGMTSNDEIDREIMQLTHNAILRNFKDFIEKENILKQCCDEMLSKFLQQFAEHQKKKSDIDQEMNRHIDVVMNYIKGDLTTMDFNDLLGLPINQRKIFQLFAPIMVPGIEVKGLVKKGIEGWFQWIISRINLANVQKFYEDTKTYVANKSASYYSKFIYKNRNIKMIMDFLFEAPNQVTRDFEKYLIDDMNYLAKNIDLLDEDMRKKEKVIQTYKEIKDKLEIINNDLCYFNLVHLQKEKNDKMMDEIEIVSIAEQQSDLKAIPILTNRNRVVYSGHFKNSSLTDSSILVYKNLDGKSWTDLYHEYLKHKEILKLSSTVDNSETVKCFMELKFHILSSVNNSQDLYPMFFVNGIDHSLKTYMDEFRTQASSNTESNDVLYKEIKRLLHQILNGLSYLHKQNPPLVHYDLTIDSIGYNSTYRAIKLSSISLETKVVLDYSITSQTYVISNAHFPVDILDKTSKQLYTQETDIYCLGIVLYHLWIGVHPLFYTIVDKHIETVDQLFGVLKREKIINILQHQNSLRGFEELLFNNFILCLENKYTSKSFYENIQKLDYYGEVPGN